MAADYGICVVSRRIEKGPSMKLFPEFSKQIATENLWIGETGILVALILAIAALSLTSAWNHTSAYE